MQALLNRSRFVVCPYRDSSEIDASGIILMSLASATPVLCSNVGGFDEYISDGENGVLVEPESVDALATALEAALTMNDHDWQKMSNACLSSLASFSWERAAEKTAEIYATACVRKRVA
jgi:glycosyltransferase involved in cell wall biosynthesis